MQATSAADLMENRDHFSEGSPCQIYWICFNFSERERGGEKMVGCVGVLGVSVNLIGVSLRFKGSEGGLYCGL